MKVRLRAILGILCGLTLARLWVDFFAPDWLVVLVFAGGVALGWHWPRPRWTFFGLLIYLASPFPLPHLAIMAVSLAAMGWIIPFSEMVGRGFSGGGTFFLFILTLSPGLLPADAGEFQVVAAEWGVAHPPGYPLYTLLAGFTAHLVPLGTMAWRVNLFSALVGAATVSVVASMVQRETGKYWAGLLAGLTLAVSTTFWMTSTQASIRPMSAFFTALMAEAVLAYRTGSTRQQRAALIRFGIAAGLGVTHHGSLLFIGLALGIFVVNLKNRKQWPLLFGAALVGVLPWLYLVIRADGFLAPINLDTWDGFWNHVLARGFASDMFAYIDPSYWSERFQVMTQVILLQWHVWIVVLAMISLVWILWQDKRSGLALGLVFLTHTLVVGTYRAPQTVEYAVPTYVILAVSIGCFVGGMRTKSQQLILGALVLGGILFSFQTGWVTMRRLAVREEARDSALATLAQSPDGGLILANWHRATPLWYLQRVENQRQDVEIQYVNPEGSLTPMQRWRNLLQETVKQHPVVVTQIFTEAYRDLPYTFENERILPMPSPMLATEDALDFGPLSLVEKGNFDQSAAAGETIRIELTWNVAIVPNDISTFVHVGASDQPPIAQVDIPLQMNAAGSIRQFYDLQLPITAPPGEWPLWTGAYTSDGNLQAADGQKRILLSTLLIHPARFPAPTQHPIFREMGAARLYGWDYDDSVAGDMRLYLHWELREEDQNYDVSITDIEGGLWSEAHAETRNQTGYWTSVHQLPPSIAQGGVTVRMDGHEIRIPAADGGERYVLFGHVAALVDWQVDFEDDEAAVTVTLLPFGATFEDIQIQLSTSETYDFTPVSGSIPSFKWAYNRRLTSRQTLPVVMQVQEIRFLLYDGFTGRVVPILDGRVGGVLLTLP